MGPDSEQQESPGGKQAADGASCCDTPAFPATVSAEAREFRRTLNDAYRRFQVLERGEKRCFGVTMSQCMTLELLAREGALSVREMAENLGLDNSTVTRTIDVLARDGLAERRRDEQRDRRQVFVSLTPQGRELAEKLQACADSYCERILQEIPAERRKDVMHALRLLGRAIEDLPSACG